MTVLCTNKLKNDIIASEPGYSNVNYVIPIEKKNSSSNNIQHSGCDSSRQNFMDCIKSCTWCPLSFFGNTNKNCCCWYCGRYNIASQNTNGCTDDVIKDVEEGVQRPNKHKCATKHISYLVSVLFLVFVGAGAILLYQSCK